MFSEVVLILQILWCRFYLWIDQLTAGCHLGNFLKNNCIMYCFMSILTPCKWSMVFAKYCRYCFIIFVLKQVYDQKSCVFLIFFKFFAFQTACTWNFTINIICMCGSITWDWSSGLCPACCPWRMCMYNSSDIRECFVQFYMSCCIRRWIVFSFYLVSI